MPDYMQYGAFGLLFLVLVGLGKLGHLFVTRALDATDRLSKQHEEDHNRMLDAIGNLAARIESGRCVYRPSAGTMQAVQPPGRGRVPSRP
jgi:hypothetical protein